MRTHLQHKQRLPGSAAVTAAVEGEQESPPWHSSFLLKFQSCYSFINSLIFLKHTHLHTINSEEQLQKHQSAIFPHTKDALQLTKKPYCVESPATNCNYYSHNCHWLHFPDSNWRNHAKQEEKTEEHFQSPATHNEKHKWKFEGYFVWFRSMAGSGSGVNRTYLCINAWLYDHPLRACFRRGH